MKFKQLANTKYGQDGAIYDGLLFRFDHQGECTVYDLADLDEGSDAAISLQPLSSFTLEFTEEITPHSNTVCFGSEYYALGDRFPLVYSNVYNNYAKEEDKRVGVCCVYRITRYANSFDAELVELIKIGFTDDPIWRSEGVEDVRPYGNFLVDRERERLYAYVMRDGDKKTRYFSFALPKSYDGRNDPNLGIRCVTLEKSDIIDYFDVPYHNYIQGGIAKDGVVYEVEGFGEKIHPAIRVIDLDKKAEIYHKDLFEDGLCEEAEMIDFLGGRLIYGDARGRLFELDLEI